jgi:peroxiredoxin-like protein
MQKFPHTYVASAAGSTTGQLSVTAEGLPNLSTAPPAEFDGPGDQWSPETLLMSSLASCFVLSFRAVAAASKFEWASISCQSSGVLDRVEKVTRFTEVTHHVGLVVNSEAAAERAEKLLHKAESVCLISNSVTAEVQLEIEIKVE